ncbi:inactive serine protease 54 [Elgaria multicarinata webbii]|uniref:inactive serine protease 54 n=1 Tax=Elgaria multicarinata webbii TaxID=159646 RepID=UPI002FCCDEAB
MFFPGPKQSVSISEEDSVAIVSSGKLDWVAMAADQLQIPLVRMLAKAQCQTEKEKEWEQDCGTRVSLAPARSTQEFAAVGELPWVVSLRDLQDSHVAFGSILSKHWILSTASQFQNRTQALALLGVPGLKRHLLPISTIIQHEAFDEVTLAHNVALLKTAAPLHFGETVQPICFPYQSFPVTTLENCLLAGWLHPHTGETGSGSLRKLLVVDADPCPLHRSMATECCSHREGGNVSGCLGYSGNPVMCQAVETGQWVLKGVLSEGGTRCYGPFLYTRVSYYSDWVVTTTAKWGAPASPIPGKTRHVGFRASTEELQEILDSFSGERALNSGSTEDHPGPKLAEQQPKESSQELPAWPANARAQPVPIYYDYYSGEVLPISTAGPGQAWGLGGLVSASLLLHLLTCVMTG